MAFICCLGQSLCPDGSVPATLAARCATAAELQRRLGALVVLSGADVSGVGVSEAQARQEATHLIISHNVYIYNDMIL